MPELHYVCPLKLPAGVQVTPKSQKRYDSGFSPSLTLDEALGYFEQECLHFPQEARVTLYSHYDQIANARARQKQGEDCSVCCEVQMHGETYYFVCHRWGLTEQNIYALHLTLRALHNIVRWGVSDYGSLLSAFSAQGKTAQIAAAPQANAAELVNRGQWLAILRLNDDATLAEANEAYRFYAKKAAGSEEGLLRLNQAIAAAREYFQNHPR